MTTRKTLLKQYKTVAREQTRVLARHNQLHPDKRGRGHEFEEYQETWHRYCELRDALWLIKREYKTKKWYQL